MRAVVSGAAGFLGSHLCEALLRQGFEVVAVDNLRTGSWDNVPAHPKLSVVEHDVTQPLRLDGGVDRIYHLASPASPRDYAEHPIPTLKAGTVGTLNMLGVAREKGARFLLASSSEVYGDPLVTPQPESYWGNVNPVGPRAVYDEAKRCAEAITMAYFWEHGVDTRIARIFNCYGPRMRPGDGRVIPQFLSQALRGQPLTVYGDGGQTRSFCYVSDLVRGLMLLMERGSAEPVNLGNPVEMTVLDLANTVLRVTGSASSIVHEALPQDDPKRRCPDIARARSLGWEPAVPLEWGLRETARWMAGSTATPIPEGQA